MKKIAPYIVFLCLALIIAGIYYASWKATPSTVEPLLTQQKSIAGIINIRTQKSSGHATINDIAEAAIKTGLNYVLITDLNDFNPDLKDEKYYENALIIKGGTYGYLGSLLLNFAFINTEHLIGPGRIQTALPDILNRPAATTDAGSFILSHPLRPGYKMKEIPNGISGIELYNLKNIFQKKWSESKISIIWSTLIYPFNSNLSFLRLFPSVIDDELRYWDRINNNSERIIYGYAGIATDARMKIAGDQFIEFPSYDILFSTVRNRIWPASELTGNSSKDKQKIFDALKIGRFYLSLDLLASGDGFVNTITDITSNRKNHWPGSIIKYSEHLEMYVEHPVVPGLESEIVVYKDGEVYMTSNLNSSYFQINTPGLYRAEVRLKVQFPIPEGNKWVKWIISNPFRIKKCCN